MGKNKVFYLPAGKPIEFIPILTSNIDKELKIWMEENEREEQKLIKKFTELFLKEAI
jgi:hypothetical protein